MLDLLNKVDVCFFVYFSLNRDMRAGGSGGGGGWGGVHITELRLLICNLSQNVCSITLSELELQRI